MSKRIVILAYTRAAFKNCGLMDYQFESGDSEFQLNVTLPNGDEKAVDVSGVFPESTAYGFAVAEKVATELAVENIEMFAEMTAFMRQLAHVKRGE